MVKTFYSVEKLKEVNRRLLYSICICKNVTEYYGTLGK